MENPLERIRTFFSSLISRRKDSDSILGIDIGSSSIKVVQLKKKSGVVVLETYGELSLGPYASLDVGRATNLPAPKLAEALKDILTEANTTTRSCGVSIPFSASLISIMTLPKVDKDQLAKMIPIEARKYIPVPISEVTLDWFVIPKEESRYLSKEEADKQDAENKVHVLLVAIHNEMLNKYRDVLKEAGLSTSFYEIEIFSTIRASMKQGVEPVMIVDIGAASTKVYVVEFGIVKTSHIINKGSQDMTLALSRSLEMSVAKAERLKREQGLLPSTENGGVKETVLLTLEYIFTEANKVLLNYQRKYNRSVSKVLFTGGGSVLKGLQAFAAEKFNADVALADPFSKAQTPAFLENVLKDVGPEFTVAVGVALRRLQELE
ncbi:type IV pilus assembly protein PilM [Candidatus Kaiserbacteria bacterium]|nr:type IV pilus assembly protein PilM [Candidatus Kaiserbacteria bacterium]